MPELTDLVPGFDAQQSFGLRTVAQEAARMALTEFREGGCRVNCKEMTDVHRAVFGATEDGVKGLDQRMSDNEKLAKDNAQALNDFIAVFTRLRWVIYTGIILALIGIIAAIVQAAIIGK